MERDLSNGAIKNYVMFFVTNLNEAEHKYMAELRIREREFKEGRVVIAQESVKRHDEKLLKLGITQTALMDSQQTELPIGNN